MTGRIWRRAIWHADNITAYIACRYLERQLRKANQP